MSESLKIIVSGSSGTIGTALCERLLEEGHSVTGIDIVPNAWNSSIQKITRIADLRKPLALKNERTDFFVHLAANPFVFPSVEKPDLAFDNVLMTLNTLEFSRKERIANFLFASSREIYGNNGESLHKESDFVLESTESPYAASKVAGEAFVHSYHNCFALDFEIFRFSNVYGRYDASNRLIPIVLRNIKQNKPITVFGARKELPFTFLDDTIEGILAGIQRFETAKNQCYNIANPNSVTILSVVKMLNEKLHATVPIVISETRKGEVERFFVDTSKAKKMLGFEAKIGIEEGLQKTVDWYNKVVFWK